MTNVIETIKGLTPYPIPKPILEAFAFNRLDIVNGESNSIKLSDKGFQLVKADILRYLYFVPNVSQGGQSYSFTDIQRGEFKREANKLYKKYGDTDNLIEERKNKVTYGYKGSRL